MSVVVERSMSQFELNRRGGEVNLCGLFEAYQPDIRGSAFQLIVSKHDPKRLLLMIYVYIIEVGQG
jgi:hypothetical protein